MITGTRTPRAVGLCALLAGVVSLFTGCLSSNVNLVVHDDRSGVITAEIEVPTDVRAALDETDFEQQLERALAGVSGARVDSVRRLGKRTYSIRIPFDDYSALSANLVADSEVLGQSVSPFSQFQLTELSDGKGWRLEAETRPVDDIVTFSQDEQGFALAAAYELLTRDGVGTGMNISVELPGEIVASNADSVVDNVAVWQLRDASMPHTMQVTTESVPFLSPLQWVLIVALVVLVLGGVLMFLGARGPAHKWGTHRPPEDRRAIVPPTRWSEPSQAADDDGTVAPSAPTRRWGRR